MMADVPLQTGISHDTCSCDGESDGDAEGAATCTAQAVDVATQTPACAHGYRVHCRPPNMYHKLIKFVHNHLAWPSITQDHHETALVSNTLLNTFRIFLDGVGP